MERKWRRGPRCSSASPTAPARPSPSPPTRRASSARDHRRARARAARPAARGGDDRRARPRRLGRDDRRRSPGDRSEQLGPGRPASCRSTPRTKRVLKKRSLREAVRLEDDFIGGEHLLLGLLREDDGPVAEILEGHRRDPLAPARTAPGPPRAAAGQTRHTFTWEAWCLVLYLWLWHLPGTQCKNRRTWYYLFQKF